MLMSLALLCGSQAMRALNRLGSGLWSQVRSRAVQPAEQDVRRSSSFLASVFVVEQQSKSTSLTFVEG
jgi:hypothetical protein